MTTTAGRLPHPTRPENAEPCGPLTRTGPRWPDRRSGRVGALFATRSPISPGRAPTPRSYPHGPLRRGQPGLLLAALEQLLDRRAHVEDRQLGGAVGAHLVAEVLGGLGVHAAVLVDADPVALRALGRDQAAPYLEGHQLRIALERITPAAAAPGDEVQDVARRDRDVVALAGQHLPGAVGPLDPL